MYHLEVITPGEDFTLRDPATVKQKIEVLTGEKVSVEPIGSYQRHFKVLIYVTESKFKAFKEKLTQFFTVQ